jgi:hypothetical protein
VLAAGGFLVVGLPGAGLCDLSRGSCPADRAAGTHSRSHFRLCDRDYHQGRDLPDLVYRRWSLVGAIVLSVGYKLFLAWVEPNGAGSTSTAGVQKARAGDTVRVVPEFRYLLATPLALRRP